MRRTSAVVPTLLLAVLVVLAGCVGGGPTSGDTDLAPRAYPERPAALTDEQVLAYTVQYESVVLHNRIVREHEGVTGVDTCADEFPVAPADGGLDYWIEERRNDTVFLVLYCPTSIDTAGAEQSDSGSVADWVTYAVSPNATRRVDLGNNIVAVQSRIVNFDNRSRTVSIEVVASDGSTVRTETIDLNGTAYATPTVSAPVNGTYEVRIESGAQSRTFDVRATGGEHLLARIGIYVSPNGSLVIDRETQTYLTLGTP